MVRERAWWTTLMLTGALVVAACSSSEATTTTALPATTTTAPTTTTSSTTTTTQPTTTTLSEEEVAAIQLEEDTSLIKALWRGRSDAWFRGAEPATQYIAEHNYSGMDCTEEDLSSYYPEFEIDGFFEEVVVDADTVEPDPEWLLPDTGEKPEGRVYIYQVNYTNDLGSLLSEVHASIIDGESYFFMPCRDI